MEVSFTAKVLDGLSPDIIHETYGTLDAVADVDADFSWKEGCVWFAFDDQYTASIPDDIVIMRSRLCAWCKNVDDQDAALKALQECFVDLEIGDTGFPQSLHMHVNGSQLLWDGVNTWWEGMPVQNLFGATHSRLVSVDDLARFAGWCLVDCPAAPLNLLFAVGGMNLRNATLRLTPSTEYPFPPFVEVFLCADDAYAVDAPVSAPSEIMRMPAQLPCCMHFDGDDEGRFRVNVDYNIYRAGPLSIKAVDGVLPILNARLVFYTTDSVETVVPLTEHFYAPHVFVFDTLQDSNLMQVACTNKVYASVARYETTQLCFEVPTSLPPPYKAEVCGIDHNVIAHRDGLCAFVLSRSDCLNGCRKRILEEAI
jgi:hypothetical protein